MEGKKKEKKLIINDVQLENRKDIISSLEQIIVHVSGPTNVFCRDSYYDDEEESLLKQGGSLKIREKVVESVRKTVIMRTKTSCTQKMKFSMWDEVEIPVAINRDDTNEIFENLKSFFPNFDFSTIKPKPILICSTVRVMYQFQGNITVYIDHIDYESYPKIVSDDLIKVQTKSVKMQNLIYQFLMKRFPESELIECSRYERALERLSLV